MKDISDFDLHGTDLINFRSRVVGYCNRNEDFFPVGLNGECVEYDDADLSSVDGDAYATAAIEHYNAEAKARGDCLLAGRHESQFRRTAKQLHEEGHVPHAGKSVR